METRGGSVEGSLLPPPPPCAHFIFIFFVNLRPWQTPALFLICDLWYQYRTSPSCSEPRSSTSSAAVLTVSTQFRRSRRRPQSTT